MSGRKSPISNEEILAKVALGYSISKTAKVLGISRTTISNRRKKDPEFNANLSRVLDSPAHTIKQRTRTVGADPSDWRRTFIAWWRKTGSRETAANYVGKTPSEIVKLLDASSDEYDEEFAALCEDEWTRKSFAIEDNYFLRAEQGNDSQAQKFLLTGINPDKYGKRKDTQSPTNIFWFSAEGSEGAKNFLTEMFGQAEPDVIDVQSTSDTRRLPEARD